MACVSGRECGVGVLLNLRDVIFCSAICFVFSFVPIEVMESSYGVHLYVEFDFLWSDMFYLISSPVVSHVISSLINLLNTEDIKRTEKTLKRWVYLALSYPSF